MKKLLYLILFTCLNAPLFSQQANAQQMFTYTTYHKLKPGYTIEDALKLEGILKIVHTARKEAGLISGWAVFVPYQWAKTPNVDFDYVTINWGSIIDKLTDYPLDLQAELLKKFPQFANIRADFDKAVSIERAEYYSRVVSAGELIKPDQIYLFEVYKATTQNTYDYINLEKKAVIVHEDRIKNGYISHWSFWKREVPTSFGGYEYFSTINVLPSLTQLVKGGYTDELAKKALNMSLPDAYFKTHSLRVGESNFLAKMVDGVY
jgi:hypothetical protein